MTGPVSRRGGCQRGDGKIGAIISLVLFVAAVIFAVKMIPVKVKDAEFRDFMEEQAKFAGDRKPDSIRRAILDKARELEIPLKKDDLRVQKPGDRIKIECTYTMPVVFPTGYTYNWTFRHFIDRPVFII